MKFKLILLIFIASCSSHDLTGTWSGKAGPFKSTFIFYSGQHGKLCYSGKGKNIVERANWEGSTIWTEGGYTANVIDSSENSIRFEVDADGLKEYTFKKDHGLSKASWFCWRELHSG
jgi:hypothetical protein